MKISYWIDFNCPYSYLGTNRLCKAIEELDYDVKMDIHSFELDVNAPNNCEYSTSERFINKYKMSEEDAEKEIEKITNWAVEDGLDFNYKDAKFTNTRDAHRLIKLAIQTNNQEIILNLSKLLFEAYFSKNLELADHEVLKEIAVKAKLNEEDVDNVLSTDKFNNEVVLDERVAVDTGIQGIPYFIFNNKYPVPGVLPVNEYKNALKRIKFEEDMERKLLEQQEKNE